MRAACFAPSAICLPNRTDVLDAAPCVVTAIASTAAALQRCDTATLLECCIPATAGFSSA